MEKLEGPFEILEMQDQEIIEFHIEKYEVGEMLIHPFYQKSGKVIKALRVHLSKEEKTFFPFYWDLTAQTLIAQVLPVLKFGNFKDKMFRIQKFGVKPRARFSLEVLG